MLYKKQIISQLNPKELKMKIGSPLGVRGEEVVCL